MAALAYSVVQLEWQNPNFVSRVQVALLQTAINVKMEAQPPSSLTTTADHEDKLARAIVSNPTFWATQFAYLVAIQLIGNSSLLDETVTTDGAIFAAVGAVFDRFLPALA